MIGGWAEIQEYTGSDPGFSLLASARGSTWKLLLTGTVQSTNIF